MCRLLVFSAKEDMLTQVKDLVNAFVKASENDPHLAEVTGGKFRSHNDGWGYALIGEWINGGIQVLHYRSLKPVYEDLDGLYKLVNTLERLKWVSALLHSRKVSQGYGKTLNDVHPFHAVNPEGIDIWLAHNGSININNLNSQLSDFPSSRADSLALTIHLSKFLMKNFNTRLKELLINEVVKTALSLGILIMEAYKLPKLKALNFNIYEGRDEVRARYYRLYSYFKEGLEAVASSTVTEIFGRSKKPLRNGEVVEIEPLTLQGEVTIRHEVKNLLNNRINSVKR